MSISWPLMDLYPQFDGYRRLKSSNVIRKTMSVGEPKSRRRSTRNQRRTEGQWVMTDHQKDVFESWYKNELADGSLEFYWPDPENTEGMMRTWFTADPQVNKISAELWSISFAVVSVI